MLNIHTLCAGVLGQLQMLVLHIPLERNHCEGLSTLFSALSLQDLVLPHLREPLLVGLYVGNAHRSVHLFRKYEILYLSVPEWSIVHQACHSATRQTFWEGGDLIAFSIRYISNSSSSFLSDKTGPQLCVSEAPLGPAELSQLTYSQGGISEQIIK